MCTFCTFKVNLRFLACCEVVLRRLVYSDVKLCSNLFRNTDLQSVCDIINIFWCGTFSLPHLFKAQLLILQKCYCYTKAQTDALWSVQKCYNRICIGYSSWVNLASGVLGTVLSSTLLVLRAGARLHYQLGADVFMCFCFVTDTKDPTVEPHAGLNEDNT